MSKSEKRYFSLDAQKSSKKGNKYFELFKAINGMDEYDETKLKKKFPKNLATDKAYLYDAILRSMRDYNSSKSISARIKELLIDAKYLKERGLYNQSQERLKEAKELSIEIDDQLSLLEINREERAIAWIIRKDYAKKIEELIQEKEKSFQAIEDFFKYSDIIFQLSIVLRKDFYSNKAELKEKLNFDESQFEKYKKTPRTLRTYLLSLAYFHRINEELEESARYFKMVVDYWSSLPKLKNEDSFSFITDVSNLLTANSSIAQIDTFPELIEQLEDIELNSEHLQGYTFRKVAMYKIMYLLNTGAKHDIDSLIEEIESGLKKYKINVASKQALLFNLTMLLFVNQKFKECYNRCTVLIKSAELTNREEIPNAVYLIKLLCSFETMDVEELEKELRNTDRYYASKELNTSISNMKTIIERLKKIIFAPILEQKERFKALAIFIREQHKNEQNYLPYGLDELILNWIEGKLKGQPILKVIADHENRNLRQLSNGREKVKSNSKG